MGEWGPRVCIIQHRALKSIEIIESVRDCIYIVGIDGLGKLAQRKDSKNFNLLHEPPLGCPSRHSSLLLIVLLPGVSKIGASSSSSDRNASSLSRIAVDSAD